MKFEQYIRGEQNFKKLDDKDFNLFKEIINDSPNYNGKYVNYSFRKNVNSQIENKKLVFSDLKKENCVLDKLTGWVFTDIGVLFIILGKKGLNSELKDTFTVIHISQINETDFKEKSKFFIRYCWYEISFTDVLENQTKVKYHINSEYFDTIKRHYKRIKRKFKTFNGEHQNKTKETTKKLEEYKSLKKSSIKPKKETSRTEIKISESLISDIEETISKKKDFNSEIQNEIREESKKIGVTTEEYIEKLKKVLLKRKEEIEIDSGYEVLIDLFEKNQQQSWVLSDSEVKNRVNSLFSDGWRDSFGFLFENQHYGYKCYGLDSGLVFEFNRRYKSGKIYYKGDDTYNNIDLDYRINYEELKRIIRLKLTYLNSDEIKFLKKFQINFLKRVEKEIEVFLKNTGIKVKSEIQRLKGLTDSQTSYLIEFDKDNNGIVDDIEGTDELMKLLRKHQKKIIEVDKNYVQNLIKVSNYLKVKRENIQTIFSELKETKNQNELENYVGILKNKIHVYQYLIFHSLNMISSIIEEDLITFYEIYESFDKLKIFNSTWENEVSEKLSDINEGLSGLMFSINKMEKNIVNEIGNLTYVTQESFRSLERTVTSELDSVNSSIKFNNLLTGISTYQLYQINKSTKSLRG